MNRIMEFSSRMHRGMLVEPALLELQSETFENFIRRKLRTICAPTISRNVVIIYMF